MNAASTGCHEADEESVGVTAVGTDDEAGIEPTDGSLVELDSCTTANALFAGLGVGPAYPVLSALAGAFSALGQMLTGLTCSAEDFTGLMHDIAQARDVAERVAELRTDVRSLGNYMRSIANPESYDLADFASRAQAAEAQAARDFQTLEPQLALAMIKMHSLVAKYRARSGNENHRRDDARQIVEEAKHSLELLHKPLEKLTAHLGQGETIHGLWADGLSSFEVEVRYPLEHVVRARADDMASCERLIGQYCQGIDPEWLQHAQQDVLKAREDARLVTAVLTERYDQVRAVLQNLIRTYEAGGSVYVAGAATPRRLNWSANLHEFKTADFNGNGIEDIFVAHAERWHVAHDGSGHFEPLEVGSRRALFDLVLGDFDGDGGADVFASSGSHANARWFVSWNGRTGWQPLDGPGGPPLDLGFGDFHGDGKQDVLKTANGQWQVSWGGITDWEYLNTSGIELTRLGMGDFDGDGRTDLFTTLGGRWLVSWGGQSGWQRLNTLGEQLQDLRFGDFNGDGKTDVFTASQDGWLVSWGGAIDWEPLNDVSGGAQNLVFADFTGDGRTDVGVVQELVAPDRSPTRTVLTFEEDIDRPGADYKSPRKDTARGCWEQCLEESRCQAFTWVPDTRTCFLKEITPGRKAAKWLVSGAKSEMARRARMLVEPDTDRPGANYDNLLTDNADECQRVCADDFRCHSYSWVASTKICWLKRAVPGARSASGIVSGYKAFTTSESDVDRDGANYDDLPTGNANACRVACENDQMCRAYTWGRAEQHCWLKSERMPGERKTGYTSGLRLF